MIRASITINGRPEKRTEIIQTIKGIMAQLNKNKKCRQVKTYQDIDDENTLFFVEDWQSEDDLDEYFSSLLFKVLLGINPLLRGQLEIKLFSECRNIFPTKGQLSQNLKQVKGRVRHENDIHPR